jgi:hypothetical protein
MKEVVRINCADVWKQKKQADQEFLALYWKMQEMYANRAYGRKICIHEAAHALYLEADGHEVNFFGPAIIYEGRTQTYYPIGAVVDGGHGWMPNTEELLLKHAKHLVAGGVAVRKFLKVEQAGDETDYRQFIDLCTRLPLALRQLNLDPEEIWTRAQDAVDQRGYVGTLRARHVGARRFGVQSRTEHQIRRNDEQHVVFLP